MDVNFTRQTSEARPAHWLLCSMLFLISACEWIGWESEPDRLERLVSDPQIEQRLLEWVDTELSGYVATGAYEIAGGTDPRGPRVIDDNFDWSDFDFHPDSRGIRLVTPEHLTEGFQLEDVEFVSFADRSRVAIIVLPPGIDSFDQGTKRRLTFESGRIAVYCSSSSCDNDRSAVDP